MIRWIDGEPENIEPGMLIHYEHGGVELVGSNCTCESSPIRRYAIAVPMHWLSWAESMANWRGHQK
ncbi:hypothetical protein D3C85_274460 [compost metagenome]